MVKKYTGDAHNAFRTEFLRSSTAYLVIKNTVPPKAAARAGAITSPEKMAAIPLESFHPHWTEFQPFNAIPHPAREQMIEYVVETGHEFRVAIMSQVAEAVIAHVKVKSWTPTLPSNAESEIMPFLMVPVT